MPIAAKATIAALAVRKTSGPNLMGTAPASRSVVSSSSPMPPSGPTKRKTSPRKSTSRIDSVASSCRTNMLADSVRSASSATNWRVVSGPRICGMRSRLDCFAAASAAACHLARAFGAFFPSHLATQRSACQAMISSAPACVARSTASSARSDLGIACTTVTRGFDSGTRVIDSTVPAK